MSGLAIWTTSIYQIWAGSKQKEYQVASLPPSICMGAVMWPCWSCWYVSSIQPNTQRTCLSLCSISRMHLPTV